MPGRAWEGMRSAAVQGQLRGPAGGGSGPTFGTASRAKQRSFHEDAAAYINQLYRVAYHLTKQKDDADDLVQETYLRAISNYTQFASGTNLKGWLTRIL